MQPKIYLLLVIAGAVAGYMATKPVLLRPMRLFQMALFPALLCLLLLAGSSLSTGKFHGTIAFPVLIAASLGLGLALVPNAIWFWHARFKPVAPGRKPLLDELHIQPIRQLVAEEKFEEACRRLESLLKTYRADFGELQLMTQLYHQVNKNKEAAKSALQMIRAAQEDFEQLTAMRFYHQVANANATTDNRPTRQPDKEQ